MSAAPSRALSLELAQIAGEENVREKAEDLRHLEIDGVTPACVVTPQTVEQIAAIMRLAFNHDLVVVPAGGFTQQAIGRIPSRIDIVLRTERLNRVEHYDPGDLTLSVGAGITIAQLRRVVDGNRQLLPIDPARSERVTVGGAIAANASGALQHRFGSIRESLLGVRFVTADGRIAKAGGRVVKNVAGYDLMKLMTGSFGTLGVLVSANLKVFPAPHQYRTFVTEFVSLHQAIQYRDRILQSPLSPLCLEIASPEARTMIPDGGSRGTWGVYLRAAGSDAVLARYRQELGTDVAREGGGADEEMFWRTIADWADLWAQSQNNCALLRVSVPSSAVENALRSAATLAGNTGVHWGALGRATGSFLIAFSAAESVERLVTMVNAYRNALGCDSMAVITHCSTALKQHIDVWGTTPTDLAAMRIARKALDRKQILNRGRFLI
ncbi:MAG TPA: FAD-binding oxidoreductase [Terriglobales bacterium]|nr:FAD-binding oxidoreductase [Terriglobales bacterium]